MARRALQELYVEEVLNANPGLAKKGMVLKAGIIVRLPELKKPTGIKKIVRLFN